MTLHPARVVASVLLIAGSLFVGVTALAIVMAKLLVECGDGDQIRPNALLLSDLITVLPFIVAFAVAGFVAAAGHPPSASPGRTMWLSGPRSSRSSSARSG